MEKSFRKPEYNEYKSWMQTKNIGHHLLIVNGEKIESVSKALVDFTK